MKNSIEEDITRVKQRIEDVKEYIEYGLPYSEYLDLENSFDNILSDYKRVLKENEELKESNKKNENELEFDVDCDWIALQRILDESEKSNEYILYKNEKWIKEKYCIPVQKVKDKIEELNQYYKREIYPSLYQWADITITEHYDELIELLQELLEGRE